MQENADSREFAAPNSPTLAIWRLLAAVAFAVAIPLSVVAVLNVRRAVADEREKAVRDVRVFAQLVATRLDDLIREHQGVLTVAAHTIRAQEGTLAERDRLLATVSRDLPRYIGNLNLYARNGTNIGRSVGDDSQARPNVADRRYFIEALSTKRLAVGAPAFSRLTGRRVIGIGMPVLNAQREVEAMFTTAIELDYLLDRLALPQLPPTSVITIIDTSGVVVARTMDDTSWVMRNVRRHPAIQPAFLRAQGDAAMVGLDGVSRHVSYRRTTLAPWIVLVGVPPAFVEGRASARTVQSGVLGVLTLIGGLLVALLFARRIAVPLERLSDDAIALGEGDSARRADVVGAGALRPLAVAFNRMADELTARARQSTEQQRALQASEAQLRQAQKMEAVGQLAGGIAHDFNNLLTVILGHVSFARAELQRMPDANDLGDSLSEIQSAGARAADLTRQLLTFARRQRIQPHVINLNATARGIDRLLRRVLGEHIELETMLANDVWLTEADPTQVEQILVNLAVNARDAMPDGGLLTIETGNVVLGEAYARAHSDVAAGEYVMLAVTDTGTGIEPEHLPHLFEPFFTTKAPGSGTGLGLAVCYGIAKRHGGHLAVYSERGRGTTFRLYLPRSLQGVTTSEGAAPPTLRRGSETILVVEDTDAVRAIAERALSAHGYTVLSAVDGVDGVRVANAHDGHIDLLLTDMVMPKVGGRELAVRLRAQRPTLKVLFTSGYTANASQRAAELDPSEPFLAKPYLPELLLVKVREVLDAS